MIQIINYYFLPSCDFGRRIFNNIATIVATTTGLLPKMVVNAGGNADSESCACERPTPRATASPTIDVFLKSIFSVKISFTPVIAIEANTEIVAPPSTHNGIVVSSAENLGIRPAISITTPASPSTTLFITFVVVTIPTFCEYVAEGSPPRRAPIMFVIP